MSARTWTVIAIASVLLAAARAGAQSAGERIRGRVLTDSGLPIANADVMATKIADRQFKTARTSADGTFAIAFDDRTGTYALRASAAGRRPVTVSVVVPRGADEAVIDVRLPRYVATLDAVVTRATRAAPRPDRVTLNAPSVGASESVSFPQAVAQRIGPDVAGDLASIAAMTSNVTPVSGGISVFGLGASQNATTLNGLAFGGAEIPRDVRASVRVSASSYDPANGWFSGARTNVQLATGGLFSSRSAHISGDTPLLQASNPQARQLGQRFSNANVSMGGDGQLVQDRYAYNYGIQATRRTTDLASLQAADADVLGRIGLAADSAVRFAGLAQSFGVSGGAPRSFVAENLTLLGRLDRAPYDWTTLTPATTTAGITAYARAGRSEAAGISPLATAAHGGTSSQLAGALQGELSHYTAANWLNTFRAGMSGSRASTTPYAQLPDGRVLVQSRLDDGSVATTAAQFGGNSTFGGTTSAFTLEANDELQLYTAAAATHRVGIAADARFDAVSQRLAQNTLGTVGYSSLANFAAGTPASFTRSIGSATAHGGEVNGFVALSDLWRANPSLQMMYGARLEGGAFTQAPRYNAALDSALGARNDAAPSTVHLSPRLGFTWSLPAAAGLGASVVRGGVGEFRNLLDPALLATPSVFTGLPDAPAQVSCIGSAVPAVAWSDWADSPSTIPTRCAGAATSLGDTVPSVRLVDRAYAPSRSWRGNLGWTSSWKGNVFGIDAAYSKNLSQPGVLDLNFAGGRQLVTSDEGRAVFVPASSIVNGSGLVSPVAARTSSAFGRVVEGVSDLESSSRQLTLTLRPKPAPPPAKLGDFVLSYTLSSVRGTQRGFDASTFDDPRLLERSRADLDARHRFTLQGIYRPAPGFFLFLFGRLQSGTPYTPLVGSDVNGDGIANDRAFIFDPARVADPALANGMRALLASPDHRMTDCLFSQLGRASGRNSCEGPWTASFNANLRIDGDRFGVPRASLYVDFQNPLAGVDQLLHGSGGARGWGSPAAPDPVLYRVRGFDPVAGRFMYDVNPRFGQTLPNGVGNVRAPFRLTLDLSLDVGRGLPEQQLDRWMGTGDGAESGRLDRAALARRLARNVPDPYAPLLVQADSLILTQAQVAALQQAESRLVARSDSAWRALAAYLDALPARYDVDAASRQVDKTIGDVWEMTRQDVHATLGQVLDPVRLSTLSGWAGQLWRAQTPVRVRIYGG